MVEETGRSGKLAVSRLFPIRFTFVSSEDGLFSSVDSDLCNSLWCNTRYGHTVGFLDRIFRNDYPLDSKNTAVIPLQCPSDQVDSDAYI